MQARIIRTKTGLIHYGVYGDEDFETQPRVKRTVRGRPPVEAKPVYFKTNDLFGRVPLKAPKGTPGVVYAAKV
jgi:hypothetical protein